MTWRKKDPAQDPTSLGNLLLKAGLCTLSQLRAALAQKAQKDDQLLGQLLVQMGVVRPEAISRLLEHQAALRGSSSRQAVRCASIAVASTMQLTGNLDSLNNLALEVLQKLK